MTVVRTRFSPSPTGMIHLGNARAALFSALFAAKHQGVFILRIEDTDASRSEEHFIASLQHDLKWLGIRWQEGPGQEGPYAPYLQSERQSIYAKYYQILEDQKLIYPCFCTDAELALARKLQLSKGIAPRYAGTCKKLTSDEIKHRIAQGEKSAWRLAVPINQKIEFIDLVKGPQLFDSNTIGDFIVRRADGTAPFLFCNAIDDAMMKVTHVLRGEDHLANTPRQILLLKMLDLHLPNYGHLSLITGDDGAPLSKRHGSFSLHEMHAQGYLPSAIMNYLARLGHVCEARELLNLHELSNYFNLKKLSRSSARFDKSQLLFWQKSAIQALSMDAFQTWLSEAVDLNIPSSQFSLFVETIKANIEFPQDALMWANIFFHDPFIFSEEDRRFIIEAGKEFFDTAYQAVQAHGTDFKQVMEWLKQKLGVTGKKLFMPLRFALTKKTYGPELEAIAVILGEEKIKQRLKQAAELAGG